MGLMRVDEPWVQILISGDLDVWVESFVQARRRLLALGHLDPRPDCDRTCAEDATESSKISQCLHLSSIVSTSHVDCK